MAQNSRAPARRWGMTAATRARVRRAVALALLIFLLLPPLVLAVFRFVPVPVTPLMVIRLVEGEELAKRWVPLDEIARPVPQAVIAAEDNFFCSHRGFDWPALKSQLEAAFGGDRPRGASTISMQTAKNLFLWPGRDPLRKVLEAWLTPQLELFWGKRRIMEVYLNIVEFGPGIYGVEAAARAYFDKSAAKLGREEAARLAAVLPNPRQWSAQRPTRYIAQRTRTIQTRIQQLGPRLDCVA
ncbi:MAG TPA: monofunctional biosynthetic peptidoglycan transglycosylase [Geminicoccaceae bacterium]|nr:monofunctional biosynthetic peptidoglycan transglycosylase [Geminicoccaceae bacterium]